MKILFMGTPDFASGCLRRLIEDGREVAAVITQPDKAMGRGMSKGYSDVKKCALEFEKPVFQPETLKDGAIKELLSDINPDIIVVVAYGKILPEYVLNFPKYGCVNVHASLLPAYRGAAPIQRAVINGDKVTGVTTMLMDKGLDTGDMLLCESYEIGENKNVGEVFDELSNIGAELLLKTLDGLEKGTLVPVKQDSSRATYAEKITAEECAIDFGKSVIEVHNRIRGLYPFPGAFCYHNGKLLKLCESRRFDEGSVANSDKLKADFEAHKDACPGEIVSASKDGVYVKCADGFLRLTELKPEGKGKMRDVDLVNGRKISVGDVLKSDNE